MVGKKLYKSGPRGGKGEGAASEGQQVWWGRAGFIADSSLLTV